MIKLDHVSPTAKVNKLEAYSLRPLLFQKKNLDAGFGDKICSLIIHCFIKVIHSIFCLTGSGDPFSGMHVALCYSK